MPIKLSQNLHVGRAFLNLFREISAIARCIDLLSRAVDAVEEIEGFQLAFGSRQVTAGDPISSDPFAQLPVFPGRMMNFLQFVEKQQLGKRSGVGTIVFMLRLANQTVVLRQAANDFRCVRLVSTLFPLAVVCRSEEEIEWK